MRKHRARRAVRVRASAGQAAEYVLPNGLYEDVKAGNVVVFAGAGISTESSRHSTRPTLYEEIRRHLGPQAKASLSFPDLMQRYCDVVDGGQKHRLTRQIIDRIEYFAAPGGDNGIVSMMHREIARVPQLTRVVTTNWDPFFERALNILVPMVEDKDIAFWDDKKKQVLKIHGCVTRPYTMVATTRDYEQCIRRYPLVFTKLRDLLATKTFMFVGFSMRDPDFAVVFDQISRRLGGFRRFCYAFDPDVGPQTVREWRKRKVGVIGATGIRVAREIVERLVNDDLIVSDEYVDYLRGEWRRIAEIHLERPQNSDGAFASAMYQDGLQHALAAVVAGSDLGQPREWYEQELRSAQEALKTYWERENVVEIAYWTGRVEVMERYCARRAGEIPAYFDPYEMKPARRFRAGQRFKDHTAESRGRKAPSRVTRRSRQ